ncbi:MAG: HAMP domain-containing histidine kinase [Gammaproteobacteria bacterium]|nr:HAMP domain-containing histidine kinase [Gammaproteobacteria bacterium]
MERSARQYQALGDPAFFIAYQEKHEKFTETMRLFAGMVLQPSQRNLLKNLEHEEDKLYLRVTTTNLENDNHLVTSFIKLSDAAKAILQHNTKLIDVEVEALQSEARRLQKSTFWQGALLIPIVIVLGGVMVILITRPIHAIDASIRQLGDGELTAPIKLKGPYDFELLGQRLDWLRIRLTEVEEQKLKFLRHISHELKTPLTNIREGAELLHDGVAGSLNGKQKEISDIIRDNSLQLQSLIEGLLHFSVAQVQQTQLNKSRFQLDKLVNDVIYKHNISLFSKRVDVRTFIEPMLCYADQEKLRTIFDNLIANACKYAPADSRLDIRLTQRGGDAVFEVIDNGPGIPLNERDLIFDPFYQGSGEYISHVKGTGLGLSIAREFVVAHQGVIEIIDGEQPGAHFVVRLPILEQVNL